MSGSSIGVSQIEPGNAGGLPRPSEDHKSSTKNNCWKMSKNECLFQQGGILCSSLWSFVVAMGQSELPGWNFLRASLVDFAVGVPPPTRSAADGLSLFCPDYLCWSVLAISGLREKNKKKLPPPPHPAGGRTFTPSCFYPLVAPPPPGRRPADFFFFFPDYFCWGWC